MQIEAQTEYEIELELGRMAHSAKRSLYPQQHRIMGHTINCDYQNGKRIVFEFDGIIVASKLLAAFIVANRK